MSVAERVITIRSQADAIRHLTALSARKREIRQPVRIQFEGWPTVRVNVKGRRYKSTLPTPLMEALLQYQAALNRVFADAMYDGGPGRLTQDDRAILELTFLIKEGSSDAGAGTERALNTLAEGLVTKCTPTQLIFTTLSLALVVGGYFAFSNANKTKIQLAQDQQKHAEAMADKSGQREIVMQALRHSEVAMRAFSEFRAADEAVVRAVPDARKVTVGRRSINRDQIAAASEKQRKKSITRTVTGTYSVESAKHMGGEDDRWVIGLVSQRDALPLKAEVFGVERASREVKRLTDALRTGETLELTLEIKSKGGSVVSARILPGDDVAHLANSNKN